MAKFLILIVVAACVGCAGHQNPIAVDPGSLDQAKLKAIAPLIGEAIAENKLPGAVVLIGQVIAPCITRRSASARLFPIRSR